jgi:hypothetical protein
MARLFLGNLKGDRVGGTKNKIGLHFVDLPEIIKYLNRKPIENKESSGKILDLKRIRSSGRILT